MKRPRPSKSESSWGRAVGPGLLIPAGLAGAVGANGCSPGPDGLGAPPVQAGPASDATDPDDRDSISGGMPVVRRNGAVSCVNDPVAVSRIGGESSKVGRFVAPQCERRKRDLAEALPAFLTPVTETPVRKPTVELPPDARIPVRWLRDRRIQGLTSGAFRTYIVALSWNVFNQTEGLMEDRDLDLLPLRDAREHVQELIEAGLWGHEDGARIQILDFAATQVSLTDAALLARRRAGDRDRKARQRNGLNARVFARDGHRCIRCGATSSLSVDHIVPWSKGGETTMENLQTLCTPCNSSKGARLVT